MYVLEHLAQDLFIFVAGTAWIFIACESMILNHSPAKNICMLLKL
jgi:hypothetical protein